ncbi:ABC transporter ATP-binding protein [Paenibacillus hexagrammi]|uniref:ABC transporter ATP-binding protein n=1 Tax=Paenibacillus hexagrammi TaxID=2908839 RepID=A0ABY3SKU3_9BACL|nr:ABC transporter ATP-binding protein [Paenibacillus sp. YPD9-1]UJF34473.1 ABC transporter ATP-binding protein [Paenibacillus sp. YPD9-1]
MIQVEGLTQSFQKRNVLEGVSFYIHPGEFFGVIGPNGSGKTTLLSTLSGVIPVMKGSVRLEGKPIGNYSRKVLARCVAVLQQDALPPVGFTVREIVEMGRYPFQNWLGDDVPEAGQLVDSILEKLDLKRLQGRTLEQLSGGERQRVALGKVMAQQPRLLLLDEPTTYLDIGYQIQMMDYIQEWQRETELTVVAVLHDLNLAALYCGRLMALHDGKIAGIGTSEAMISGEMIKSIYDTEPVVLRHPVVQVPQILLQPGK